MSSTWGGNLADMVRATRIFEVIAAESLVVSAAKRGQHLLTGLETLADRSGGPVTNTRGRGLMCAFDLPDGAARDALLLRLFVNQHLILPSCGERSIRFRPPLTITATADARYSTHTNKGGDMPPDHEPVSVMRYESDFDANEFTRKLTLHGRTAVHPVLEHRAGLESIEPNALLIWNNHRMTHSRTGYTDRRRHLRRVWLAEQPTSVGAAT